MLKQSTLHIIEFVIVILLILGGVFVVYSTQTKTARPADSVGVVATATPTLTFPITQEIKYGKKGVSDLVATVSATQGETALDLLQRTQQAQTSTSSYGILVENINGFQNGTDKKYWSYYVNGKMADVGAGVYRLQINDHIEWRFSAYAQ